MIIPSFSTDQADALDALQAHPGWLLWLEHVRREWGANGATYNAQLDQALNLLDDNAAASQARQIRAGRRTIEALLAWPREEVARLRRTVPTPDSSQSRRGGL